MNSRRRIRKIKTSRHLQILNSRRILCTNGSETMAVPFRDLTEREELGLAGYLRFVDEPDARGIRAALFFVNGRGEPVEFSFSRIDVPASFLWRAGEARRQAITALAKSL